MEVDLKISRLAKDDTVRLVEEGNAVARQLGDGKPMRASGGSMVRSIAFSSGNGSLENRTITAILERRGIPHKEMTLDTFDPPENTSGTEASVVSIADDRRRSKPATDRAKAPKIEIVPIVLG